MAKFLSQDQIYEYKECFSLYDKQQRGKIKATDLLVSMRCLGASPTPGEVQRHLQTHGIDKNGELDFSTFLTIMHMQIKQEDPKKVSELLCTRGLQESPRGSLRPQL